MIYRPKMIIAPGPHYDGYRQALNAAPVTTFADSFTRADADTWGANWIRTLHNMPGGGANGVTAFAAISTNDAVIQSLGGAGATQSYAVTWIPLTVFKNLYNTAGVFVQVTLRSAGGNGWGIVLRYNHDLLNTETQAEGSDFYIMIYNGRIDKVVGSAPATTIGAATWAPVANDVLRFECLTVGNKVTTQSIRNGVILQTIDDTASTRILQGGPGVQANSLGASGAQSKFRTFSCGPLTALST